MDYFVFLAGLGMVVGLIGLWWSSDKAIESSLQLCDIFKVTKIFVGFVFMAIATGLPELAITIASLWNGVPEVAVGTIIGSNLVAVSLVLGLPAIVFGTLNVKKEDKLHLMFLLAIATLVMAFIFIVGTLHRWHGLLLMLLYGVVIWWLWRTKALKVVSQKEAIEELSSKEKLLRKTQLKTKLIVFAKISFSFVLVTIFSKLSIDSALAFTRYFPIRFEVLGATLFAVGTSLPELALSFQAVKKKEYSLAFGNSFGSVLEQTTLILGLLAIGSAKPLNIVPLRPVAPLMFMAYAIVAHTLLKKTKVGRQEGLGRWEGTLLIGLFLIHIVYYAFFF